MGGFGTYKLMGRDADQAAETTQAQPVWKKSEEATHPFEVDVKTDK